MAGEYYEDEPVPRRRPKSGAVTAVAIVNFVLGGLALLCGFLGMLGGAIMGGMGAQLANDPNLRPEQAQAVAALGGGLGILVVLASLLYVLMGAMMIVSGIGVIKRRSWGRILSLVVGGLAILSAILSIVQGGFSAGALAGAVIPLGYAVFVYVILLNADNAAEFS